MKHFCITYRWELLLFMGVPLAPLALETLALNLDWPLNWYELHERTALVRAIEAAVLAGFLRRVRSQGRQMLTLVWEYSLLLAVAAALIWSIASLLPIGLSQVSTTGYVLGISGASTLNLLVQLSLLAWFARRASRLSLAHAFFLYVVTTGLPLGAGIIEVSTLLLLDQSPTVIATYITIGSLISIPIRALALAWLLGRFDSFTAEQRKRAVVALLAISLALSAINFDAIAVALRLVRGLIAYAIPLGIIYLVRDKGINTARSSN